MYCVYIEFCLAGAPGDAGFIGVPGRQGLDGRIGDPGAYKLVFIAGCILDGGDTVLANYDPANVPQNMQL